MLFLEHDLEDPQGNRIDRWWTVCGECFCNVPWAMIDSGRYYTCGRLDYAAVYAGLVDKALAHPPAAEIAADYLRIGSSLLVTATVTNRSGTTLGDTNLAAVNVLVYERVRVVHTDRFVRAATHRDIVADLPDGQTGTYSLRLMSVPVQNWFRAAVVVLVDYRPDPLRPRFEMLQAAVALPRVPPGWRPDPGTTTIFLPCSLVGSPWD